MILLPTLTALFRQGFIMSPNLTDQYIDNLYRLKDLVIADTTMLQAKRCLLDYLGVTFAGAQMLRDKGGHLFRFLGEENGGDAAVIGFNRKAGLANAVFVNGLSAHIAEYDDGVRYGAVHPGSPILSALLPVAEKEDATGGDLLLGIVTGYEAAVRLASSMQPSHYSYGYHPTGTCGAVGAAIGIAAMMGFSKAQMKDALSSAAVTASGMLKVIEDGSELKPYNVARAAQAGLYAACMARAGFKGLDDVLSGPAGFLSMMCESYDESFLRNPIGNPLCIEKGYLKPYASCRHTHAAIEATLKIRMKCGINSKDVKMIKVSTYRGVLGKHDHKEIRGVSSAKMSIPYSVAVALVAGEAGLDQFTDEQVHNCRIQALMKNVEVCSDDSITALVPHKRVAAVEIITVQGTVHTERVEFPKGEPENPLSDSEVEEKFLSLTRYGNKSRKDSERIMQIVWNIKDELPGLFSEL